MGVYVCIQPPLSTRVIFCSLPWTKLNSCQVQLEWQTNTWRDISLIFYDLFKFVLKKKSWSNLLHLCVCQHQTINTNKIKLYRLSQMEFHSRLSLNLFIYEIHLYRNLIKQKQKICFESAKCLNKKKTLRFIFDREGKNPENMEMKLPIWITKHSNVLKARSRCERD